MNTSTGNVRINSCHAGLDGRKVDRIRRPVRQNDQHHIEQHFEDAALVRKIDEERVELLFFERQVFFALVVNLHAREINADEREHDREDQRSPRDLHPIALAARGSPANLTAPQSRKASRPRVAQTFRARRVDATCDRDRPAMPHDPRELAQHRDESRVEDRNEENEDRHCQHGQKTSRSAATHVDQRGARKKRTRQTSIRSRP